MTEEKLEKECKCAEVKKCAKKVLVIALGTFIGFYGALSLFAATHKPPMRHNQHIKRPPIEHRADFGKGPNGDVHRVKLDRKDFGRRDFDRNFQPKEEPKQ